MADTIGNAKSADDLLGPMQDLTKAGRASRMAINDIENVTASPWAVARAKFRLNGGVAPLAASKSKSGLMDTIEAGTKTVIPQPVQSYLPDINYMKLVLPLQ